MTDDRLNQNRSDERSALTHRWRAVAIVCGSVAILSTIGLLTPLPYHGRISAATGNLCHTPMFGMVTLTFLWAWQRLQPYRECLPSRRPRIICWRLSFAAVSILAASVTMEAIQEFVGRTASWHDIRSNGWGILAGGVLHLAFYSGEITAAGAKRSGRRDLITRPSRGAMTWAILFALVCVVVSSVRPVGMLLDVYRVGSQFPLLGSFESSHEFGRWYLRGGFRKRSTRYVTDGKYSGRFRLVPGDVVGPTLIEMQQDWSSFDELVFDVTVDPKIADDEITLLVQICDVQNDQRDDQTFRDARRIKRGESAEIRIDCDAIESGPKNRKLDLTRIEFLDIQLYDTHRPTVIYLDNVRLE